MKNLYFLCLAKQNFKLTVLSKGYITLHPSYLLISSVRVCTRASFFSDEAPQWCHTRSRAVPDTVYPQLDQNILLGWAWVWSYILKRHLLVLVTYYECYENYTLLPELWIINCVRPAHLLLDVEPHNVGAGTGLQVADDSAGSCTDETGNWVSGTETASYEIRAKSQNLIRSDLQMGRNVWCSGNPPILL